MINKSRVVYKMKISKINPSLTLEYLIKTRENLYLDRKRAKVSLQI